MLDVIRQDLFQSVRSFRSSPGPAATVILVLALAIGANTALFTIIDRVLLRPFSFPDPDRLVQINGFTREGNEVGIGEAEFEFLQSRATSFQQAALWLGASPCSIVRFVVSLGLRPVAVGMCFGTVGALAVTRVMESELFDTNPTDPAVFVGVIALLLAAAAAGASVPARRALRIDPATTLRAE